MSEVGARAYELPPERAGRPAPDDLAQRRAGIRQALANGQWRSDIPGEDISLGGVRAVRFRPEREPSATVLHMHGGGFRLGCPEIVGPFATAIAKRCGVTVICPAYRLAPEHPFPAGLADARKVQQAIIATGERHLILSGDSAGGGLAAALAAMSHADAVPPMGLVLLSAWLDLTVSGNCYIDNAATDPLFSLQAARDAAELYLQGQDARHPLVSPLFADPGLFPPTLVNAGCGEVLADDSRHCHDRLAGAGVSASLSMISDMEHVAVTRDAGLTGAAQTMDLIVAFIDEILRDARTTSE